MQRVETVVIGAGIAGLSVADQLQQAGRTVAVFEARDRVGGRLHAHNHAGHRLDLGATWFWPNERRVIEMVRRFDLPIHGQHLDGDALFHQPGGADRINGNPLDVTSGRFTTSAAALAEALASTLSPDTVQLGTPIRRITATEDTITVEHDGGSVIAEHIVLALPPALAVASIEFNPPLPERLRGLAEVTPVWMGAIAKVVAIYERPFWRDRGLAGAAISHVGPMREIHDMSGADGTPAALFGFAPGSPDTPTATAQECLVQLVELFGPDANDPIDLVVHDWRAEPFTSPPGVERMTAYQTFGHDRYQRPALDGRLHWASTETATEAPGHIEGALAAAERTTSAIVTQHPERLS